MKLEEFKTLFNQIRNRGFVRTLRKGPTGIGYTLETMIGMPENNIALPDMHEVELKAHRTGSGSLITLFTFNNKVWKLPPLEAIKRYGSLDQNGRVGLYYTMSLKPNSAGLFLYIDEGKISVRHISGEIVAVWEIEKLTERFEQKLPAILFVSAFTEERAGVEYFHYYRAQLMNGTNPKILADQFKNENILIDLRLHDKGTRARNHGTGFRVSEGKLPLLFERIEEI